MANWPISKGRMGNSFPMKRGRGKTQFLSLALCTTLGFILGVEQRTGPIPWSSAMCRSSDGSELWLKVALAPCRMGTSTSVWKTLLWEENFFRRGLESWEAPILIDSD